MLVLVGARLQSRRGAVSALGAGCLSRRADADHRVPQRRLEGRRIHRPHSRARTVPRGRQSIARNSSRCSPCSPARACSTAISPRCRRTTSSACSPTRASLTRATCSSPWRASDRRRAASAQAASRSPSYLAGYLLMTLLSFLVLIVVANHSRGDDILHFNGLAQRSPLLAFGMLTAMLSLAGDSVHRRLHRQISRLRGRGAGAAVRARRLGIAHRRRGLLLLPARRRRDVLAGAERRHADSDRRTDQGQHRRPHRLHLHLRHLSAADFEHARNARPFPHDRTALR